MNTHSHIESLDDLAFKHRNRSYGAYRLRILYPRILLFSLIVGIVIYILIAVVPFMFYYFEPIPLVDKDYFLEVELYKVIPPPDEELLTFSAPKQEPEIPRPPVVQDSIQQEEPQTDQSSSEERNVTPSDTIGKGGTGSNPDAEEGGTLSTVIDVLPRFPGGDEARHHYIRKNLHYPEVAIRNMIQGTVMVVFVVETDGSVSHVQISKGIGGKCDEEAIRVVENMPRWEPGKRGGRPVRVMLRMPIVFRIPGRPST
jgi:protein TonB